MSPAEPPSPNVHWRAELGLWWPDADGDPAANHAYVMNRVADSDLTVARCPQRRVCVQAGGHVGLWPLRLARSFARVLTFELMPGCYEACRRNCEAAANVEVSPLGLGQCDGGSVAVRAAPTAGSWRVDPAGAERASLTTIDALGLADCDAIVLDVEGHEIAALEGARQTIARCRPVIHVEELPRSRESQRRFIDALGYREVRRVHNDVIYLPR